MRKLLTVCLIFSGLAFVLSGDLCRAAELSVYDLKCEYKTDPIGIDPAKPRLSWKIRSSVRAEEQSAYHIRAAGNPEDLASEANLIWEAKKVKSDQSTHVVYQGSPLTSRQRIWWQVRVWDNHGNLSDWSEPALWEMGLLKPDDWAADWIEPVLKEDMNSSNPCPMIRKQFEVDREVKSARAYITCLGLYEMQLNGEKVGDQVFTPGWTSYHNILQYQTYDITSMIKPGANCFGAILGDGWYRGRLAWGKSRNLYGEKVALLAQIEIVYQDGSREIITTDKSWKAATGPILFSDIYDGELYDARLEKVDWSKPGFDDSSWSSVTVANHSKDILVAPAGPPVKKIEQIKPVKIFTTPAGETVVDMGQNMVGWIRLNVQGPTGTKVKLRHAEVLDRNGNFYTENLRNARQTVEYILKGQGPESYEPCFTFQGFRYVAVEGWPGELSLDNLTGIVVHSDITPIGTFECSNPMLNQLQHNIKWGQKGNFLDVPTDCPQRDERLGWTGDAQVFARTACFNADVAGFFTKWLADVAVDQQSSGAVPHVIPNVLSIGKESGESASAGWADAAVVVPWTVYLCYGDERILEKQYSSMKAWVDYMATNAGKNYLWQNDFTFGDWLAFSTDWSDYPGATTSKDLVRQAYFVRSTDLLMRTARILKKNSDANKYSQLLKKIKKAFLNEFVTANGRISSETQTAYSLALAFDLMPDKFKANAAQRLAKDVDHFKHITTGFLGTPAICHVLSEYGYLDQAYMLLNRKEYPSWLYPITKGATTIWERWDGIKPDGSFQNSGMNSFNHYAYGAIGEWLYRVVAGIEIDEANPGYKHIIIQPNPGGDLTYAMARLESMYGPIESKWEVDGKTTMLDVEIPPNTSATIRIPSTDLKDVLEGGEKVKEASGILATINNLLGGGKKVKEASGILATSQDGDTAVVNVGSGQYSFQFDQLK
ncbi:MAG: glycoside hydrolase family 78 protein [Sedimentisphaerales bacterium]|nr:glycoside hydrolase family 78 protein [Sedimentisphaerales bacterium]